MKKSLFYIVAVFLSCSILLEGCLDVAYEYDVENGFDDNTSDAPNVTVDTLQGIDVSMYEQARIFPGLVDTLVDVRTDTTIILDLSKPYIDNSTSGYAKSYSSGTGASETMPQPIYSTGLYAGAGELVTIRLPQEGNTWGLSVQIGMQTDNLGEGNSYLRQPVVFTRKALFPGENRVRFPLGGYIWIIREQAVTGPSDCSLEFKNVYAAPDYIVDKTDPAEWSRCITSTTVPWLDLRGEHIVISIDRTRLIEYLNSDPDFARTLNDRLHIWDLYMEYFYNVSGHNPDEEVLANRMPDFPTRFIFDVQLLDNAVMRSESEPGIMLTKSTSFYRQLLSPEYVDEGLSDAIYLAMHDRLNPTYDPFDNRWQSAVKLIPAYRIAEQTGRIYNRTDYQRNFRAALSYAAADSAKSIRRDDWIPMDDDAMYDDNQLCLLPFLQISKMGTLQDEKEWAFHSKLAADVRAERKYVYDESYYFRALCNHYQSNFTPFYDQWGIAVSDADRDYATQYELPDREYWKIDPLDRSDIFAKVETYDQSRFRYRHNRTQWEIFATDKTYQKTNEDTEYNNESSFKTANLLLDGNLATAWHSYLGKGDKNGQQDSPYELPYYLVIDMKEMQTIEGFFFGNGSNEYLSGFKVQYTTTTDFEPEDDSVQWQDLKSVSQTKADALYNLRFYDLDTPVQTRYLRIVITDPNVLSPNADKPEDVEALENYHKHRRQCFAEFGTYYYK